MTDNIHKDLINWLDQSWFGMPDSQYLMDAVKAVYTKEEAILLTGFPYKGSNIEDLAKLKQTTVDDLLPLLDAMAQKGLVWKSIKKGTLRFSINDSFFVFMRSLFWPKEKSETAKASAQPINQYFYNGLMDKFSKAHSKGLRTIPIHRTIKDTRCILPFEDVVNVIDDRTYYSVSDCPCRSRKQLDEKSTGCNAPLEVCLHFDTLGEYIVENKMGRQISKQETFDILKAAADAGLVHAISNWKDNPDTICNCCSCCYLFFQAHHELNHHKSIDESNFHISINPETCKACKKCVTLCPMNVLTLQPSDRATNKKGQAPYADLDLCLGCGVCVHACPTQSLILGQKENINKPSKGPSDWAKLFIKDQMGDPKYRKPKL